MEINTYILKDKIEEAVNSVLCVGNDTYLYNLTRHKSAFGYGTMTLEDFQEIDEVLLGDIVDATTSVMHTLYDELEKARQEVEFVKAQKDYLWDQLEKSRQEAKAMEAYCESYVAMLEIERERFARLESKKL